ncbi:DUF4232 domain-containing protein [Amycolatopsis sp. PS_44_ISF1]|uniref:DUF4232 domain-containing protein n=1 Tax=Amycolatopsis sp. PS_44_ISF1 TaxID=2974917 RepID=UPI0028DEF26E|nr:DUF4232 domain-containing protein [Amycolatopsis sp. PS_44_ISF1]MDT8910306.1 DUF4232 domain-containing protein [Amycolatopsis sp. PS_44_ISF1]
MASFQKPRISLVFLSAAGASAALLLSACGGGGTTTASGGSSSPAPTSSTPPATTASSSPSTPASSPSASGGAPGNPAPVQDNGLCKADDVTLSLGQGDAGAGSSYRPLDIKNTSSKPCTIQGFPGVSYVGGNDGQQIGPAAVRAGDKGEAIRLNPGQTAAADLQFVNVRNFDPDTCKPTAVKGLRVYLPQETASKFLPDPGTGCSAAKLPGQQLSVKTVHRS